MPSLRDSDSLSLLPSTHVLGSIIPPLGAASGQALRASTSRFARVLVIRTRPRDLATKNATVGGCAPCSLICGLPRCGWLLIRVYSCGLVANWFLIRVHHRQSEAKIVLDSLCDSMLHTTPFITRHSFACSSPFSPTSHHHHEQAKYQHHQTPPEVDIDAQ